MGAAPAGCGAIWHGSPLPVSSLYFSLCYVGLSGTLGIPNDHGGTRHRRLAVPSHPCGWRCCCSPPPCLHPALSRGMEHCFGEGLGLFSPPKCVPTQPPPPGWLCCWLGDASGSWGHSCYLVSLQLWSRKAEQTVNVLFIHLLLQRWAHVQEICVVPFLLHVSDHSWERLQGKPRISPS